MSFKGKYVERIVACDWCDKEEKPGFRYCAPGDYPDLAHEICLDCLRDASDLIPTNETPEPEACFCDKCGRPEAAPSILSQRNLCDDCALEEGIND